MTSGGAESVARAQATRDQASQDQAAREQAGRPAEGQETPRAAVRPPGAPPGEPRRIAYLYLLPAFVLYALFLLAPLAHSLWLSFYTWDGLTLGTWNGLGNYRTVLTEPALRAAFAHALLLIVFYAVIPVGIGLVLAATLSRSDLRGIGFFRVVLFLPQVVAMVVVAVAWRRIYAPDGPLNSVLKAVGLSRLAHSWLGDYGLALPAVGLVGTWVETGLTVVLFLAGIGKISKDLYEAARVDGAGPVREFLVVTLPSLRNEIAVALTLTVIAALRNFDLIYITTRGGPGNATAVPSYEVYHQAFEIGQVGLAAAIGITLTLVIFVISFAITRVSERASP